jgi:hypothetical protein
LKNERKKIITVHRNNGAGGKNASHVGSDKKNPISKNQKKPTIKTGDADAAPETIDDKRQHHQKISKTFSLDMFKPLKLVHRDIDVSNKVMLVMNLFMTDIFG